MGLYQIVIKSLLVALALNAGVLSQAFAQESIRQYKFESPQASLERFNSIEARAIDWNNKYQQASAGSWEEKYANQQIIETTAKAIIFLRISNILKIDITSLEQLASDLDRKYGATRSGSEIERFYDVTRRVAYELVYKKMQNELSGQMGVSLNIEEIEYYANQFEQKYQQASSGSQAELAYGKLRDLCYQGAIQKFESLAPRLSESNLYAIQEEYQRRYQQASSGSAREKYVMKMRDIARRQLM